MSRSLKRIMLVEDDPDIAVLAEIALRDVGGFEFVHFPGGGEALAGVQDARPDLVVLDYSMPGMSGADVLIALRADPATAHLPVVFLTASVMPAHVAKLKARGALDVIPKPFDPLSLADRLRDLWERHQAA